MRQRRAENKFQQVLETARRASAPEDEHAKGPPARTSAYRLDATRTRMSVALPTGLYWATKVALLKDGSGRTPQSLIADLLESWIQTRG